MENEIISIFKETKALLEGHFLLSSGLHSPQYLQCAKVLQYPELAEKLCALLGEKFKDKNPTCVIAPALGGVIVSYETARALGVKSFFTERTGGEMTLRRGFELTAEDKVLIVEDVITTGKSTKEVVETVKKYQAEIIGIGSIVDRSGGSAAFEGIEHKSLIKADVPTYGPGNCPLCRQGSEAIKPGSRNIV